MKNIHNALFSYDTIEKDKEGYLKHQNDWNPEIAKEIAKKENIFLTDDHWVIIYFVRNFYFKFNITPSMRILIQNIQKKIKQEHNISIYLFKLFPKGPAKQASKIAGIPKPIKCL
ncbi:MAG: TusE/DsrC/DsvC family sulfur relay protein [Buchnera aphidicola]|nr:TusE/DsrC/DsvC family sulfur relay protein [Buchnera aphidicola]MDE5285391.1 TusE/DsrC/DsvC family sulfur relay protein [Buchnera aphidicola]